MYFKKALIKEYGEQVWRDAKARNCSYKEATTASVWVAAACGYIPDTPKGHENFEKAILKYATETPKPEGFY